MAGKNVTSNMLVTSQGHLASNADWLDVHFEACRPEYEAMLQSVGIEPGWRVLDAGCGGGSFLPLMTELVGPTGHITALDLAPENVAMVNERLAKTNFSCVVETEVSSVTSLRYQDNTFDAVWCANVSQYLTEMELMTMLAEFRRVTRPGGLVAVKEFDTTLTRFYPADPTLLWRALEANRHAYNPFQAGLRTVGLPGWFEQAGLVEVGQKETLMERRLPLRPVEQQQIGMFLTHMATLAEQSGVSQIDITVWRSLKDLSSSDHIMKRPDFYFREGHMLVVGKVPPE